jgi:NAD(P) transhydrogenase subunit alpha
MRFKSSTVSCLLVLTWAATALPAAAQKQQHEQQHEQQQQQGTSATSSLAQETTGAELADAHVVSKSSAVATELESLAFVFMLATFVGIGVIQQVSRLLHTPLMSLTNAISAISVVGAIIVAGGEHYPIGIRILGSIALFTSMTNIISGFLITDRMLKMFKTRGGEKA